MIQSVIFKYFQHKTSSNLKIFNLTLRHYDCVSLMEIVCMYVHPVGAAKLRFRYTTSSGARGNLIHKINKASAIKLRYTETMYRSCKMSNNNYSIRVIL